MTLDFDSRVDSCDSCKGGGYTSSGAYSHIANVLARLRVEYLHVRVAEVRREENGRQVTPSRCHI